VRLLIEDNYIIDAAYLYFDFEKSITINSIVPNEAYISGGMNVTIYGNLSYFFGKNIQVTFGNIQISSNKFYNKLSKDYIIMTVPPVSTA